ncbi:MAG: acetolactate synthase catalytic subunit [Pseudomonadota bacterium]
MEPSEPRQTNETVAMRIAGAFRRHGVDLVFGQSIPSAFHLVAPQFGITQAAYRTENAGGAMADGYARIARRVGVVTAQNGPAATLLVPPLAEALKASVPVIALVQDVALTATGRNAFQELDHLRLFDGCAKWVRRIDHVSRVDDTIDMAFTAATSGRPGPAVLLVPADLLNVVAQPVEVRTAGLGHTPLDRSTPDPAKVAEAAALLSAAERPLVIAGGGVHTSDASEALMRLQETCHLPVATTVMGKGCVDETHTLSLGVVGYAMGKGSRTAALRPMIEDADVILLIGNRTNQNGTDSWTLYPKTARYIHVDIDGTEIGRNYEAVRLVGDARRAIDALRFAVTSTGLHKRAAVRGDVAARITAAMDSWRSTTLSIRTDGQTPVRPEQVMDVLDRGIDGDTIVVADASYASIWVANYLTARKAGQRFLTPRGLAGLGWGLPMAIGAKLAAPDKRVVCLAGDGGFAHTWAELEMLRRMDLDITVLVLNNQVLGYQKDAEDATFGAHTDACYFEPVDHAMIARACGCEAATVATPDDLAPALSHALGSGTPYLVDIQIDPEARPPITAFEGQFRDPY